MIIHFISPSWRNLAKIWMTTVVCGFFFVLLKFLFFPRVSSYRLTDRTHKGRGQAPTLSDPPLSNTSFCLLPRAYKFAQGPHPMWFPTLLKHPFFAPPPPRTGVRSNLLQIWRCGIQIIHFMANWVFCEFWFEFQGREKGLGGKGGWCANNPSGECKFPQTTHQEFSARFSSRRFVLYSCQFCSETEFTKNILFLPLQLFTPNIYL